MGRRADEPLEKKDIILFKGDWDELTAILAPRKVKPTVFIRALVRQKLNEIKARADIHSKPVAEVDLDKLAGED